MLQLSGFAVTDPCSSSGPSTDHRAIEFYRGQYRHSIWDLIALYLGTSPFGSFTQPQGCMQLHSTYLALRISYYDFGTYVLRGACEPGAKARGF